jgi:alkylhydroperoxidase family enzyme
MKIRTIVAATCAAIMIAGSAAAHDGRTETEAVRDAGYTDAKVMEIVALVAMYSLTNFFDNVFDPEKDFPAVTPAGSI